MLSLNCMLYSCMQEYSFSCILQRYSITLLHYHKQECSSVNFFKNVFTLTLTKRTFCKNLQEQFSRMMFCKHVQKWHFVNIFRKAVQKCYSINIYKKDIQLRSSIMLLKNAILLTYTRLKFCKLLQESC